MKSSTETLIKALRILEVDIRSEDGVANACIAEAAERLLELKAQRDELLEALELGRTAIGEHIAPSDCYATGPLTGNYIEDLIVCPACRFISAYEKEIAKAKGV